MTRITKRVRTCSCGKEKTNCWLAEIKFRKKGGRVVRYRVRWSNKKEEPELKTARGCLLKTAEMVGGENRELNQQTMGRENPTNG